MCSSKVDSSSRSIEEYVFTKGEYLIGRFSQCDIRLQDPLVSRVHTQLVLGESGLRVLDMGSSPTHKGIIFRKYEEGMSPPDIARATGHTLAAVDSYLGTYDRVKVLLRRGFDVETICQVTGKAKRTIAQYLVIVECYHRDLLRETHHQWLAARRRKTKSIADPEAMAAMARSLKNGGTPGTEECEKIAQEGSEELGSQPRPYRTAKQRTCGP